MTNKYYLGLGSNIEPRLENLKSAVKKLQQTGSVISKSSVYETEPWGNKKQSFFYNSVVFFVSELRADLLLDQIKKIEHELGRPKSYEKWAPRTIDIDILFAEGQDQKTECLEIPHSQLKHRKFVLQPMLETALLTNDKNLQETIKYLLKETNDISKIRKINVNW